MKHYIFKIIHIRKTTGKSEHKKRKREEGEKLKMKKRENEYK
jgi:hypothetical protein